MEKQYKIEIILEDAYEDALVELLTHYNAHGHSAIRSVSGRGQSGEKRADGVSSIFESSLFIVICSRDVYAGLKEPLRLFCSSSGAFCFVSEVELL